MPKRLNSSIRPIVFKHKTQGKPKNAQFQASGVPGEVNKVDSMDAGDLVVQVD